MEHIRIFFFFTSGVTIKPAFFKSIDFIFTYKLIPNTLNQLERKNVGKP